MARFIQLLAIGALAAGLAIGSTAQAEIYRYTDEQGKVHAVGSLDMVPEAYRQAAIDDADARKGGGSVNVIEEPSTVSPQTPAAPRGAAAPGTMDEPSTIGGHDQQWWRSQARERREKLEELKQQHEASVAEDEDWSSRIYGTGGSGKGPRRHHRNRGKAAVLSAASDDDEPSTEELEQEVARAEADLEQFHDDARRAGVPPGWLR